MPKLKSHSGAKKRFNLTKTGKVKRAKAFKSTSSPRRTPSALVVCAQAVMRTSPTWTLSAR